MSECAYAGSELELFAHATNWKRYWSRSIRPWLAGDVLEVGAGIGSNTTLLASLTSGRWTCLEPDPRLCDAARRAHAGLGARCEHVCGTLADIAHGRRFDTIVYLDVLEHIEDDRAEVARAAGHLNTGGRLIVLAPAHPSLFSPFDRSIGHFRRYDRASLRALTPDDLALERLFYLDSVGLCASLANRVLLRQSLPTLRQVRTWDRLLVPLSRLLDPLLLRRAGKSIVAVWRRGA